MGLKRMLNQERVRHMTHMAMKEKKYSREYMSVVNTSKQDYLSMHATKAFILGTITYAFIYLLTVYALFQTLLENLDKLVIVMLGLIGILGYLMYLYVFMGSKRRAAKEAYRMGKEALNERIEDWNTLEEMYIKEEENKSPTMVMDSLTEYLSTEEDKDEEKEITGRL